MNLYHDLLLDHYRHPRGKGRISHAHFSSGHYNPSCGDTVLIYGTLDDPRVNIAALGFEGSGCVISQATASLLVSTYASRSVDEVLALQSSDVCSLIGMQLGPNRLGCALLPLQALQEGLKSLLKKDKADARSNEISSSAPSSQQ